MFDWDEANIAHIAEHNVLPPEAEEACTHKPVALYFSSRNGEQRFVQIGETLAGRVLLELQRLGTISRASSLLTMSISASVLRMR